MHGLGVQTDAHEEQWHEEAVANRLNVAVHLLAVVAAAYGDACEERAHRVAQPYQLRAPRHRQADDRRHNRDAARRFDECGQSHQPRRHPQHHDHRPREERDLLERNQPKLLNGNAAGADQRAHDAQQDYADHVVRNGCAQNRRAFLRVQPPRFFEHGHRDRHRRRGEHHADEQR